MLPMLPGPAVAAVVEVAVDAVVGLFPLCIYLVPTEFTNCTRVFFFSIVSMNCFSLNYLSFTFIADLLMLNRVGQFCLSSLTMSNIDAG